jgi:hypothetical protein
MIDHVLSAPHLLGVLLSSVSLPDLAIAGAGGGPAPAKPAVKIGAVVATSGPAGLLGRSFLKAIQLAKEDLKGAAGRITKEAGTGNFRSSPAVWVIKDGKPALAR